MKANTLLAPKFRKATLALCLSTVFTAANASPVATPTSYTVANITSVGGLNWNGAVLNDSGQVTGYTVFPGSHQYHAFRYHNGTLTDLGALNSPIYASFGSAINADGKVTGRSYNGSVFHAFLSDGVTMTDLGALNSSNYSSEGLAINAAGTVAGNSYNGNVSHAFRSDGTTMTDLGALNNANNWSNGSAINASGQVAGYSYNGTTSRAFRTGGTSGTTLTDLGALGNPTDPDYPSRSSYGYAINANGQVLGQASNGMTHRAFVSDGTTITDLGSLSGSANHWSYGAAINASGLIVGEAWNGTKVRAFVYDGTAMNDLGTLGPQFDFAGARAINDAGQIVGHSWDNNTGVTRAFIKSPGDAQMIDLNTRLLNAPGLEISHAFAISDSGYIVAYTNAGYVLLKPAVPTPPPTAPTISPITANDPVPVNTAVNVSAQFSDVNTLDTHTATWTWEGNGTTNGTVSGPDGTIPGSVTGTKAFTAAGVYNTTVKVTDSAGLSSQVTRQVVVYDPTAGFVTGGGWIMSPAKAYKADETLAGRATFGFVSKYQKGATKPSGETEFQFHAAKLHFHSNNYEWLVVSGARAQYKGTGTINGMGSHKFLLTAVDGDLIARGTPDRFRMKIWHYDEATQSDVVDYDNQVSTTDEGSNTEGTVLGGGSINIKSR